MKTYAPDYWQTLLKLRLPAALPFVFNALKINTTLAMIGAIVAEFFGTPTVGMGFRISTEVGHLEHRHGLGDDCRGGGRGLGVLRAWSRWSSAARRSGTHPIGRGMDERHSRASARRGARRLAKR